MLRRINWKVALPAFVVGWGLMFAGLAVAEFEAGAVSGVLIELGAAVALVVVLVLVEQGVVRQAEVAARQVAEEATAELRNRVVRLENLDEAQAEQREHRRRTRGEAVDRLRQAELSAVTVGDVLLLAHQEGLVADGRFRVRTSDSPDCHVLHLLTMKADNGVWAVCLDFEPFEWGEPVHLDGKPVPMPARNATTVMWIKGQDAAEISSELEAGLERVNRPFHGFSFGYALQQVARSVEVVAEGRAAPAGDPRRLRGELELLINDQWAITTFGLESVTFDIAYQVRWSAFDGGGGVAIWNPTGVVSLEAPPDEAQGGWEEARSWVVDREGWLIRQ